MKSFAFIFLLSLPVMAFGQNETGKFQLGVHFSPEIAHRTVFGFNEGSYYSVRHQQDQPRFGYTTGVTVAYSANSWLELETGFFYSLKGFLTPDQHYVGLRRGFMGGPVGHGDIVSMDHVDYDFRFHYLEIPLRANGLFGKGKWKLLTSLSVTGGYLVEQQIRNDFPNDWPDRQSIGTDNYQRFLLSAEAAAGIHYGMNDHFALRMAPTLRFGLNDISKHTFEFSPWNAGVQVSCYYRF